MKSRHACLLWGLLVGDWRVASGGGALWDAHVLCSASHAATATARERWLEFHMHCVPEHANAAWPPRYVELTLSSLSGQGGSWGVEGACLGNLPGRTSANGDSQDVDKSVGIDCIYEQRGPKHTAEAPRLPIHITWTAHTCCHPTSAPQGLQRPAPSTRRSRRLA